MWSSSRRSRRHHPAFPRRRRGPSREPSRPGEPGSAGAVSAPVRQRLAGHWQVDDALDASELAAAVRSIAGALGPVDRLLGTLEQLQVAARPGARGARHRGHGGRGGGELPRQGAHEDRAAGGRHPLRPPPPGRQRRGGAGLRRRGRLSARRQAAGRGRRGGDLPVDREAALDEVLRAQPAAARPAAAAEEFIRGQEHSFDTVSIDGELVWHSLTHYLPAPLEVGGEPLDPVVRAAAAGGRRPPLRRHPPRGGAAPSTPSGMETGVSPHGVVPPRRRLDRHLRGRGAPRRRPVHDADLLRPRPRLLPRLGAADDRRRLRPARAALRRRRRLPARPGPRPGAGDPRPRPRPARARRAGGRGPAAAPGPARRRAATRARATSSCATPRPGWSRTRCGG